MAPKIRNIIIFAGIAVIFILLYIFFIKPVPARPSLVSSEPNSTLPNMDGSPLIASIADGNSVAEDFLKLLLSVQKIKLDDTIFSDPSFLSLHDSSITLVQDGTEGRPNPFAQFGNDAVTVVSPTCVLPKVLDTTTNTCVTSAKPSATKP